MIEKIIVHLLRELTGIMLSYTAPYVIWILLSYFHMYMHVPGRDIYFTYLFS